MTIRVRSTKPTQRAFSQISEFFYIIFSNIGNNIISFPHHLFYILLFIMAVIIPIFGAFVLGCILCNIYRKRFYERIY